MDEFQAEGRGTAADLTTIGNDLRTHGPSWSSPHAFSGYLQRLLELATEETATRLGRVPQTTLWWVDGDEYLGRIAIRHRLTDALRLDGGHIGYDVRPSARRRGHATAMLRAVLPLVHRLGVDPALLTCDTANIGSRTVIERNGGRLGDEADGKRRYWLPTATTW